MTNYLDVTIVITPAGDGLYNVRADSTEGQASATLKLPFGLADLRDAVFGVAETVRGIGTVTADGNPAPRRSAADYGADLFTALFQGEVGNRLVAAMSRANYLPDTGVRIRLSMDLRAPGMAEVASLPWELMCRPGERAFAVSNKTALVRGLDTAQPITPLPFVAPLRILVLMSNPAGTDALKLDEELARIKTSWAKLPGVMVDYVRPVRQRILDQLSLHDYHVLHYMGHGDFEADNGGVLLMETEAGAPDPITADELAMMLDNEPLRLVFLNACKTGTTGMTAHPYAGVATALIRERIPAVVAMQFPISDSAAITFAETFYKRIASGEPVDVAVCEGRKAIYSAARPEWATPVLYMRSADGNLFAAATAPAAAAAPVAAPVPAAPASRWSGDTSGRLKLFLATTDQDWERKQQALAAELGARSDCAVIAGVALDAPDYAATVEALLREADLTVHLLGANAGRRVDVDDDKPLNTYPLQQLDAGLKLAQSQIVLITEADRTGMAPAYAARLTEIAALPRDKARFELVVTDKNQMLDAIVAKVTEIQRARQAPKPGAAGRTAFVDAHVNDQERAIDLVGYLEGHDVSTDISTSSSAAVTDFAALDDTVRSTGLYVIVAGDVDRAWVTNRKMAILKSAVKSRSRLVVAKYAATPDAAAAPVSAARLEISALNDGDRSWVDALFNDDGKPA